MRELIGEKYRVIREIGTGGGGSVFQVYDLKLERFWAAKRVENQDRVMEERVLQAMESVSAVRIVDVVVQGEEKYLIMDWIDGESLQQRIERSGACSVEESVRIAVCVCKAFEQLHGMEPPVLYLDCKPSNIMLEKNGRVLLVDFGSAVQKEGSVTQPVAGSAGYTAPEQQHADPQKRKVDERSDIFSLGKTLYAALGGQFPDRPPFGSFPLRQVNRAVPDSLCRIVEKCMDPVPQRRYQTAESLRHALETQKKIQKKRRYLWNAAGLLVFLLLCAAAWELAEWIRQSVQIWAEPSEKLPVRMISAVRLGIRSRTFIRAMLWILAAFGMQSRIKKKLSPKMPDWEVKQSVLRTMKRQKMRCLLAAGILGLLMCAGVGSGSEGGYVEAAALEQPLFGLRDASLRRLLIKKEAVLKLDERIFVELDPACLEKGKLYQITVCSEDEDGKQSVITFFLQAD